MDEAGIKKQIPFFRTPGWEMMDVGRSDGGRGDGNRKRKKKRGGSVSSRSFLFYIVLAQTLCAHDTLQGDKTDGYSSRRRNDKGTAHMFSNVS